MPKFPRKRAIFIGADAYVHLPPLDFSGKDARDVARVFQDSLRFEEVLEFTTESQFSPKYSEILHNLGAFLKNDFDPDELLVFFFSGHGMIDENSKEDYLLPLDATPLDLSKTGLSVADVAKKLVATGCRNIAMFIDACREETPGAKGIKSVGTFSTEAIRRNGVVTFFSCDPSARSYEIDDLKQGSFTHCVLEAIAKGECETVEDIDKWLRDKVPVLNKRHGKPAQLPFTVIEPAEKAHLAIFYSEIKRRRDPDRCGAASKKLADLFLAGSLSANLFNAAIVFLQKTPRSQSAGRDKKRMNFIELLCNGTLTPIAFEHAWLAVDREESKPSPKRLPPLA